MTLPNRTPQLNEDSQPFWDATEDQRLTLQRCRTCEAVIWFSRAMCPECMSFELERFDAAGTGTIYSFSVPRGGGGRWGRAAPYVVAYVELDEGPRVLTNIVDCDPEVVHIGMPVTVVWHPTEDGPAIYRFTPLASPTDT